MVTEMNQPGIERHLQLYIHKDLTIGVEISADSSLNDVTIPVAVRAIEVAPPNTRPALLDYLSRPLVLFPIHLNPSLPITGQMTLNIVIHNKLPITLRVYAV